MFYLTIACCLALPCFVFVLCFVLDGLWTDWDDVVLSWLFLSGLDVVFWTLDELVVSFVDACGRLWKAGGGEMALALALTLGFGLLEWTGTWERGHVREWSLGGRTALQMFQLLCLSLPLGRGIGLLVCVCVPLL